MKKDYLTHITCPCEKRRHYLSYFGEKPKEDDVFEYTCPENKQNYTVKVPEWDSNKEDIASDDTICITKKKN